MVEDMAAKTDKDFCQQRNVSILSHHSLYKALCQKEREREKKAERNTDSFWTLGLRAASVI